MGFAKIRLIFSTLVYVKLKQLYFQIYYRLRSKLPFKKRLPNATSFYHVTFPRLVNSNVTLSQNFDFQFLNISESFVSIDWNFSGHGKLWTYNLNYFDFLQQENLTKEQGLELLFDFCKNKETHRDAYEPYPISLRSINWVKFLSHHKINESIINQQLYQDLYRMFGNLEYHILANHLMENGFGLLFGAYYFQDEKLYQKAKKILKSELQEQILQDGAHYELTPMYHQIILYRILDSYQLVTQNSWKQNELREDLLVVAEKMLGWLKQIQFENGSLPLLNDSTLGIAPSPQELFDYAQSLGLAVNTQTLGASGYRKFKNSSLEVLIDVGQIAPSYQPGHSHADSLQLLINKEDKPVLVDTGISTYEKNQRRQLERSTCSHNTVTVNGQNSSEVWSGFRVGRRAKTTIEIENDELLSAFHNGYRKLGLKHQRTLNITQNGVSIVDTMDGSNDSHKLNGHLHFHPNCQVSLKDTTVLVDGVAFIEFQNDCNLILTDYSYCLGYNQLQNASKIIYSFHQSCQFNILN